MRYRGTANVVFATELPLTALRLCHESKDGWKSGNDSSNYEHEALIFYYLGAFSFDITLSISRGLGGDDPFSFLPSPFVFRYGVDDNFGNLVLFHPDFFLLPLE